MTVPATRRSATYWIVNPADMTPIEAVGYRCDPHTPEAWWFPAVGYSIHQDRLYSSCDEAKEAARGELRDKRARLDDQLARLG